MASNITACAVELLDDVAAKITVSELCLARLATQKSEIETKIADLEQQLATIRAANPDFYPRLAESDFDARYLVFDKANYAYKTAIQKLNKELMDVNKESSAKKAEIAKKLALRGTPIPTTDEEWSNQYQVFRQIDKSRNEIIKKFRHSPPSPKDVEFFGKYRFYSTYESCLKAEFTAKTSPISKSLKILHRKLSELEAVIKEETWRLKYLTYAHQYGLVCDDENIFRVCNVHHMNWILRDWEFDCPCNADPLPNDWTDDHTFCEAESRCTYGTKMCIEWESDTLDIGFIDNGDPLGYVSVMRF